MAFYFLELKSFDDNKGEFSCTTDVRYRWTDLRLAYPAAEAFHGYKEWRGKAAEEKLAMILPVQIHDPHASAGAVRAFALAVAAGRCYGLLAYLAARTNHAELVSAFVAVAPDQALKWLATQLAVVNGISAPDAVS